MVYGVWFVQYVAVFCMALHINHIHNVRIICVLHVAVVRLCRFASFSFRSLFGTDCLNV